MSNNTRSNSALAPHRGLSQAMPPAAKLQIEIPSTTQQRPEATNASGSLNPASIPLPSSPYEDLLNEWIVFPDEDQPEEVSVPAQHNLDGIPIANHDDHAEKGQFTTSPDEPTPPTNGDQFDTGALLPPSGTASGPENQVASLNPEAVSDWNSYFKDNEDLYADIAAMMMVNDSTPPQTKEEVNTVGNVVSSNPTQGSLGVHSQSVGDPTSQSEVTPTHTADTASIATPASGLSADSAAVTFRPPSTTANNSQPSGMEIPLGPVAGLSNASAEHLSSGSVINIFNGNNTVNMSYYQTPSGVVNPPQLSLSHDQTGTTPTATAATPVLATPPPTPDDAPIQPRKFARAPASNTPRTLAPRPQPRRGQQGLPNSTFKPTPLKQSWTFDDLEAKGEPTADDPSNSPVQSENTASNQLATAQAISGPVEAYGPAQPQAPAQTGLKYANHHTRIQQPQSRPRRDTNSKVNPHWPRPVRPFQVKRAAKASPKSYGPNRAPTRLYTQAPQNVQTTPAQKNSIAYSHSRGTLGQRQ
ncbi:hypothetical protein RSOL_383360 [Rhizoctonia solani AG-3 Rhs1AP]|uniref:Uncharacterized protein n=1 Tax=Rhizoctonia solani AG-3 Rhs1AP TaxID=1086054 RepID=X8JCU6_9AGAM|nr:hypothetical protein RSOL_383360 [Rhizoctonia solani AG-3 Rhs1AP]